MWASRSASTVSASRANVLHSSIQLPREALGRVLAGRLHEQREPLRGLVGVRRDGSVDGALELFDLAARHVLEACLDALSRIGLLSLRLLAELSLAARQPSLQLLEGPAALGRMRFELAPNDPERVLERAVEIGTKPPTAARCSSLSAESRSASAVRRSSISRRSCCCRWSSSMIRALVASPARSRSWDHSARRCSTCA
jgi:hypothetical protein